MTLTLYVDGLKVSSSIADPSTVRFAACVPTSSCGAIGADADLENPAIVPSRDWLCLNCDWNRLLLRLASLASD